LGAIEFGWAVERPRLAGFKLRCGGLDAASFPSPKEGATVIAVGCFNGVPLKFSAGLHHPIRRDDSGAHTHMPRFPNIFLARVLCGSRFLQPHPVLEDEDPNSFSFDADGLRWREYRASVAEIEVARRERVISFGSCSFDEPRDDLRALGLLTSP